MKSRPGQLSTEHWKKVAPFLVGGLLASAAILYVLAEFHEEISETWLINIEQSTMEAIHGHTSPFLTVFMFGLTFIGSMQALIPAVSLIALWQLQKHHTREALLIIIAVGGSAILNVALKLYFHRQRPDVPWALAREDAFSFPSGHSLAAITLYGILGYLLMSRIKGTLARAAVLGSLVLLVLGIGVSRIYLGVHYPSDVAAGYLSGLIWLSAVVSSDIMLRYRRAHPWR